MSVSSSKESILKKIRKALSTSTPLPFPQSEGNNSLYQPPQEELEMQFAEAITQLQGKFAFCLDYSEMAVQLATLVKEKGWTKLYCHETELCRQLTDHSFSSFYTGLLADCDASITSCESLVAITGTIVLSAASESGRTTS